MRDVTFTDEADSGELHRSVDLVPRDLELFRGREPGGAQRSGTRSTRTRVPSDRRQLRPGGGRGGRSSLGDQPGGRQTAVSPGRRPWR